MKTFLALILFAQISWARLGGVGLSAKPNLTTASVDSARIAGTVATSYAPYRLKASDGSPDSALFVDTSGNIQISGARLEVTGGVVNEPIGKFTLASPVHSAGIGVEGVGSFWGLSLFQDDVKRFTIDANGGALIGTNYVVSNAPTDGLAVEGNVGIGTTVPDSAKLTVIGALQLGTKGSAITDSVWIVADSVLVRLRMPGGAARVVYIGTTDPNH